MEKFSTEAEKANRHNVIILSTAISAGLYAAHLGGQTTEYLSEKFGTPQAESSDESLPITCDQFRAHFDELLRNCSTPE